MVNVSWAHMPSSHGQQDCKRGRFIFKTKIRWNPRVFSFRRKCIFGLMPQMTVACAVVHGSVVIKKLLKGFRLTVNFVSKLVFDGKRFCVVDDTVGSAFFCVGVHILQSCCSAHAAQCGCACCCPWCPGNGLALLMCSVWSQIIQLENPPYRLFNRL